MQRCSSFSSNNSESFGHDVNNDECVITFNPNWEHAASEMLCGGVDQQEVVGEMFSWWSATYRREERTHEGERSPWCPTRHLSFRHSSRLQLVNMFDLHVLFFFYCGYVNMYRNLHSIFDGSDRLTMCGLWIIAEHVFFRLCSKPSWSPTARRQTHFGWQINLFLLFLFILHERMCFFEQACFPLQEHDIETPYGMLHVVIRGAPKGNKPAILTYHDVGLNRE